MKAIQEKGSNGSIILDLGIFDNAGLFDIEFSSVSEIDDYISDIEKLVPIKHLERSAKAATQDETNDFFERNYKGDSVFFAGKERVDEHEIFPLLRTYIRKTNKKYLVDSWDFGIISPRGWKWANTKKFTVIDGKNPHTINFRTREFRAS